MHRALADDGRRGGPGRRGRGHRLRLRQGRHGRARAVRAPAAARRGGGRRGPGVRPRRDAAGRRRGARDVRCRRGGRRHLQPGLRLAAAGARWSAGWPRRSSAGASRSTRAPGPCGCRPGRWSPTTARYARTWWSGRWRATRPALAGHRRTLAPVYSLMIATEPLPAAAWERIGLARRETFTDHRHLIIYGQRTADDRLAFGGRGAPYHFGSRVRPAYDREPAVFGALRRTLTELFGIDAPIAYRWGGPLGIPRDWMPSVGLAGRPGLGRRLRRRRRRGGQPGRPHPRRPDHRRGVRADPPALGRAPLARAGSRSRCAGWASTPRCAARPCATRGSAPAPADRPRGIAGR